MATKKVVKEKTLKPEAEILSTKCPNCVNGRIPQKVDWHYVSCEMCNGTSIK